MEVENMNAPKFVFDVDAELKKIAQKPANPANPANREKEISNFSKISDSQEPKTLKTEIPNQGLNCIKNDQILEAAKHFKKKGWTLIFSTYLNQKIYIVKNKNVQVPEKGIAKYTKSEIESLKKLSKEELMTLHDAKVIFGGVIS